MGTVKIVTDSTAYLSAEEAQRYGITVVPLVVNYRDESFKEGERYTNEEFYRLLRAGGFPTTSQPSVGDFMEAYQRIAEPDVEIISIHLSAEISGTYNSAKKAAETLSSLNVTVYDSRFTCAAQAFMVREAARMAAAGSSVKAIVEVLDAMRDQMYLLFMVDTMEYLRRGGRIGGAQAVLGTLLQIKPILHIRGKIDVWEKVRTRKKALGRIVEELAAFSANRPVERLRVAVLHIDALDVVESLTAQIKELVPGLSLTVEEMGPVIGSHVGPGTVGVAFCAVP